MNPDPRTLANPRLTYTALGCLYRGLGLSTNVRASVTRACRKLSRTDHRATAGSGFSPYNPGPAPSLTSLKRELENPDSPIHRTLTRQEVKACRTFVLVREAVGVSAPEDHQSTRRPYRAPLHSFGAMRSALPTPSRGAGFWR